MKRNSINYEDKKRLVEACDRDENYMLLAEQLGINRNSALDIINKWRKFGKLSSGKRGGIKNTKISNGIDKDLIIFVENNTQATLEEMQSFINNKYDLIVSFQTISKYLHGQCVSVKLDQNIALNETLFELKGIGDKCTESIFIEEKSFEKCVYVGECAFNFWLKRPYGCLNVGKRTYKHCCGQSGKNVLLCMAFSMKGVVHFDIFDGNVDMEKYQSFITELSSVLGEEEYFIIQDDKSIHRDVQSKYDRHKMFVMSSNSPLLNPIEAVFSSLKSEVKNHFIIPTENLTIKERMSNLKSVILECIEKNCRESISEYFNHARTFNIESVVKKETG